MVTQRATTPRTEVTHHTKDHYQITLSKLLPNGSNQLSEHLHVTEP